MAPLSFRMQSVFLIKWRGYVFQRKMWRSRACMRAIARCCILEQFGVSTRSVEVRLKVMFRRGRYGVREGCASIMPGYLRNALRNPSLVHVFRCQLALRHCAIRAGQFKTISHESLQCLCFDLVRFSKKPGSSFGYALGTLAARFRRPAGVRIRPPAALGAEVAARLTAAPFWASAPCHPPQHWPAARVR